MANGSAISGGTDINCNRIARCLFTFADGAFWVHGLSSRAKNLCAGRARRSNPVVQAAGVPIRSHNRASVASVSAYPCFCVEWMFPPRVQEGSSSSRDWRKVAVGKRVQEFFALVWILFSFQAKSKEIGETRVGKGDGAHSKKQAWAMCMEQLRCQHAPVTAATRTPWKKNNFTEYSFTLIRTREAHRIVKCCEPLISICAVYSDAFCPFLSSTALLRSLVFTSPNGVGAGSGGFSLTNFEAAENCSANRQRILLWNWRELEAAVASVRVEFPSCGALELLRSKRDGPASVLPLEEVVHVQRI
jgi:hypothetical protein